MVDVILVIVKNIIVKIIEKKQKYLNEASLILRELKGTNEYLENRMELKIEAYKRYVEMTVKK